MWRHAQPYTPRQFRPQTLAIQIRMFCKVIFDTWYTSWTLLLGLWAPDGVEPIFHRWVHSTPDVTKGRVAIINFQFLHPTRGPIEHNHKRALKTLLCQYNAQLQPNTNTALLEEWLWGKWEKRGSNLETERGIVVVYMHMCMCMCICMCMCMCVERRVDLVSYLVKL